MAARDNILRHARHNDPPRLTHAALLVVDLQEAFTDRSLRTYVRGSSRAVVHALRLIDAFRVAGRPVAFSRHAHRQAPEPGGMGSWWSSFVMEGTSGARLDRRIVPLDGELVVRKESYSAFRATKLRSWLATRGIDTVVVCGTMTHICVDTTARDAFMQGLDVVIAREACASKHPSLHACALEALAHACARVCDTETLLASLTGGKG